jgi:dihydrolipoamide dehydrogenase
MLRDSIQPFPTFSEVYIAALEGLHGQITTALGASAARGPYRR